MPYREPTTVEMRQDRRNRMGFWGRAERFTVGETENDTSLKKVSISKRYAEKVDAKRAKPGGTAEVQTLLSQQKCRDRGFFIYPRRFRKIWKE